MRIEDELRASLRRHADATPPGTDPVAAVERTVAVVVRRRRVVAATASLVLVLAGTAVALRSGGLVRSEPVSPGPSAPSGLLDWPTRGNKTGDVTFEGPWVRPYVGRSGRAVLLHRTPELTLALHQLGPRDFTLVTFGGDDVVATPFSVPVPPASQVSVVFDVAAGGQLRRYLVVVAAPEVTRVMYRTTGHPAYVDAELADGVALVAIGADADARDTRLELFTGDDRLAVDVRPTASLGAPVAEPDVPEATVPEPLRQAAAAHRQTPAFRFCLATAWAELPTLVTDDAARERLGWRDRPRLRRILAGYAEWTRFSSRSLSTPDDVRAYLASTDPGAGGAPLVAMCAAYGDARD